MEIGRALEKAFKYPWKNRSLWSYGILIALFGLGSSGTNYTPDDGDYTQIQSYLNSFNVDWTSFWLAIGALTLLGLAIGILGMIVSSWSQAAIIGGVSQLEKGKKINRKSIGKTGKRTVWNLIVLTVLIPMLIILGLIVAAIPLVALVAALPGPASITVGVVVGLLAVFAIVPVAIYFGVIWALAPCAVVLENKKALEALKLTVAKVRGDFWMTLLFLIIISIINGMIMFFFFIPLFIFGGLAIYFWANALVASLIFGLIAFLYIIFLLFVAGYFQAVMQTGWTVWWLELNKKKGAK